MICIYISIHQSCFGWLTVCLSVGFASQSFDISVIQASCRISTRLCYPVCSYTRQLSDKYSLRNCIDCKDRLRYWISRHRPSDCISGFFR